MNCCKIKHKHRTAKHFLFITLQHGLVRPNARCNPALKQTIIYGGVRRMTRGVSQPEERSCSVVWCHGSRYVCITFQTAAGWTGCYLTHRLSLMLCRKFFWPWSRSKSWLTLFLFTQMLIKYISEMLNCRTYSGTPLFFMSYMVQILKV